MSLTIDYIILKQMKKTYSKPQLRTEKFTPQHAISACWISTLTCQCSSYTSTPYLYNRPSSKGDQNISTLSSHSPYILRVTIKTDGETAPTITPLQKFYSEGVFDAYASDRKPFHQVHTGTPGLAWSSSGTYHFTTSQPTSPWEKNQS